MAIDRLIITRRGFGIGLVGGAASLALPLTAMALTVDLAKALVGKAIADVNKIINSGKSEAAMQKDFEGIFIRYGDVPMIARSALGTASRRASPMQLSAFTEAYQGYLTRKYGKRFREFIGGQITITDARPVKNYFEVVSTVKLTGHAPFDLRWHVSDKSGKIRFFNLVIEGINMLSSERTEIGAMLDQRRDDIDALIADLKKT